MTSLIWASFNGDVAEVKELVAKLPHVNGVDEVSELNLFIDISI